MAAARVSGGGRCLSRRVVREIRYPQVSAVRRLDDIEPLSPVWRDVYTMFIHLFGGCSMSTTLNIRHWGNSLGVRLPASIARAAGLSVDQQVEVAVEGDRIVLTPVRNRTLTLEERLARFDPDRHAGEAMSVSEPLGNERF